MMRRLLLLLLLRWYTDQWLLLYERSTRMWLLNAAQTHLGHLRVDLFEHMHFSKYSLRNIQTLRQTTGKTDAGRT